MHTRALEAMVQIGDIQQVYSGMHLDDRDDKQHQKLPVCCHPNPYILDLMECCVQMSCVVGDIHTLIRLRKKAWKPAASFNLWQIHQPAGQGQCIGMFSVNVIQK